MRYPRSPAGAVCVSLAAPGSRHVAAIATMFAAADRRSRLCLLAAVRGTHAMCDTQCYARRTSWSLAITPLSRLARRAPTGAGRYGTAGRVASDRVGISRASIDVGRVVAFRWGM